jgi:hypothetical protein
VTNLDDTAKFVPGTYEFVATAPGYGHLRFRKSFHRGEESTIELRFATNYASANNGAVATGDTSGADAAAQAAQLRNLIDDAEASNAFPGDPPRPVAPILILREFDIPNTKATHLRLVVKTNQCTGGPAFQGDQDADPINNPDCDTNPTAGVRFVRAAELQAFAGDGSVHRSDD